MPFGTTDRSITMNSPRTTAQTAIGVVVEDVVGSLQHAPLMDSMSSSAWTSPLTFSATSSASRLPSWTPKKRRRRSQRDHHQLHTQRQPAAGLQGSSAHTEVRFI